MGAKHSFLRIGTCASKHWVSTGSLWQDIRTNLSLWTQRMGILRLVKQERALRPHPLDRRGQGLGNRLESLLRRGAQGRERREAIHCRDPWTEPSKKGRVNEPKEQPEDRTSIRTEQGCTRGCAG